MYGIFHNNYNVKISLLSLLFLLFNYNTLNASESLLFIDIPEHVSNKDVSIALKKAASNRKWTVVNTDNEKIRISLDHSKRKALLTLLVSEGKVTYTDLSQVWARTIQTNRLSTYNWAPGSAPESWIKNLRNDVRRFLFVQSMINRYAGSPRKISKTKLSFAEIEKRIKDINKLHGGELISEENYRLEMREILSQY